MTFFYACLQKSIRIFFYIWIVMLVNLVFKIMPRFFWWMYIDLRCFLTVNHHLEFKAHFVPLWIHCESVSPHFVIFLDNHCHKVLICCQQYYLMWYFLFYWPWLSDHLFSQQLQCRTCGMSSLIQKKILSTWLTLLKRWRKSVL